MFQEMYEKAIRENADIVCCEMVREMTSGEEVERYPYDEENKDIVASHLEYGLFSAVWNKLVKRSLYTQYNILPVEEVSMWEDFCVTARLRYHSRKTVVLHKALYHYNNTNTGSITVQNQVKRLNSQIVCSQFLMDYFETIMPRRHYIQLLEHSFHAKSALFFPPYYDLKRWRTSLRRSNRYIMSYNDISTIRKLHYILFLLLPFPIADYLLRLHYRL